MNWRDELLSGLPAPRGDEPASLRRDIEDELADHIHCAMQRERVTATDDETARKAVLKRFGNPRLVAYKLWWDAMKEKVMKDRLMMAASVVMMVTCILAVGALWLTLKENREVNAALLAQIRDLAARPAATAATPSDKASLKLKVVLGTPGGKPVEGFPMILDGTPFTEKDEAIRLVTDKNGMASVGLIRPGRYQLSNSPSYEGFRNILYPSDPIQLTLFSGQVQEKTIVCPANLDGQTRESALAIDWPAELSKALDLEHLGKDERFLIGGRLEREPQIIDGITWIGQSIEFLSTLEGDYALETSPREVNTSTENWYELRIPKPESFRKTHPLQVGCYRLARLFIRKGLNGSDSLPVNLLTNFERERVTVDIPAQGTGAVRITIPAEFRDTLLAAYPREATLELHSRSQYRFRDLKFDVQSITNATNYFEVNMNCELTNNLRHFTMNTTLKSGNVRQFDKIQATLEKCEMIMGEPVARVHFQYHPALAAQASSQGGVLPTTNPTVLYEGSSTRPKPQVPKP